MTTWASSTRFGDRLRSRSSEVRPTVCSTYIDDVCIVRGRRRSAIANLKVQQGIDTRNQLIAQAHRLFAKQGFADTRFDAVGADLGMTSGAMYHHFRNKHELFEEVVRRCHAEIAGEVLRRAETEHDTLSGVLAGCLTFIEQVTSSRYIRIVLVESVAVLGWEKWKEIDSAYSENALGLALHEAQESGSIAPGIPIDALARFISGGTNELALWVYHRRDKKAAMNQAEVTLRFLIDRLSLDPHPEAGGPNAMEKEEGMINSSYTVIKTAQVDETARFFETYFGFERSFAVEWYISLRVGAFELAVLDPNHESVPEPFRGKTSNQGVFLNFETDEVDEIFERFVSDGRTVHLPLRDEPWGQRHFITEDPNGIPVDVIKMIPPSGEYVEQYA